MGHRGAEGDAQLAQAASTQSTIAGMKVSTSVLLGASGFACFIAWYMLCLFDVHGFSVIASTNLKLTVQAVAFLGIFLFSAILRRPIELIIRFASSAKALACLLVLGALLPCYMLCVAQFGNIAGILPLYALMLVSSFPALCMLVLWESISGSLGSNTARVCAFSLAGGIILFLLVRLLCAESLSWVASIIFLLVSLMILYVLNGEVQLSIPQKEELPNQPTTYDVRIIMLSLTLNIGFGMIWPSLTCDAAPVLGIAAILLIAFSGFVNGPARLKDNTVIFLIRICVTGLAVGFLVGQAVQGAASLACCCVAATAWLIFWSLLDGLLIHRAQHAGISIARYLAPTKVWSNAGFACGWVFGSAVTIFAGGTSLGRLLFMAMALILIVVSVCLLPFGAKILRINTTEAAIGEEEPLSLEEKIGRLSSIASLTRREEEVAFYLAKGRNAHAIAEKLVLSENTVRSHIHNIYRKVNVHSQREFIELLKDSKFDPMGL